MKLSEIIIKWYEINGRKGLPWQKNKSLYYTWLSETMLQQTQVSTVIPYFKKFIARFPDIQSLAKASLNEVLFFWSGLGYYARARNLHKTAKKITEIYNGFFPVKFKEIISLPGIGRSTAGAILSLSKNLPYPILDGNIKRILTRYYGIQYSLKKKKTTEKLWKIIEKLIPNKKSQKFNQAMMDLGAIVCINKKPKCNICPIKKKCYSFKNQCYCIFYNEKKRRKKKIIWFLILKYKKKILLIRQKYSDLWGGLFIFPKFKTINLLNQYTTSLKIQENKKTELETIQQNISNFYLEIKPILINIKKKPIQKIGTWYNIEKKKKIGLPASIKKIIKKIKFLN